MDVDVESPLYFSYRTFLVQILSIGERYTRLNRAVPARALPTNGLIYRWYYNMSRPRRYVLCKYGCKAVRSVHWKYLACLVRWCVSEATKWRELHDLSDLVHVMFALGCILVCHVYKMHSAMSIFSCTWAGQSNPITDCSLSEAGRGETLPEI